MKLIPILTICILALTFCQQNPVSLEKRKKLVNKIKDYLYSRRRYSSVSSLIKDMTAHQTLNENTIPATKESIEKFIQEKARSYPPDLIKSIRTSLFVTEAGVVSDIKYGQGHIDTLTDMVGSFIKDNNYVYIIYIKSFVSAVKIIQKERYTKRECRRKFLRRDCWDEYHYKERGFRPYEIEEIKGTMMARASQMCKIAIARVDLSK